MSTTMKRPVMFAGQAAGDEKFFKLERRVITDGTKAHIHIIWDRPSFVLVVATTETGNLVLIQEYKQAVKQDLYCLPAGTIKPGESPIEAGLRELRQESGYTGSKEGASVIGPIFNSPDKSTERHWVVILKNVIPGKGPQPEPGEAITRSFETTTETALSGDVKIGMHLLALYLTLHHASR